MAEMTYTGTLAVTTCHCGVVFAVPVTMWQEYISRKRRVLYCPMHGHTMVPKGRTPEQLQRERAEAANRVAQQWKARADELALQLRAQKGQTTRARRKAVARG